MFKEIEQVRFKKFNKYQATKLINKWDALGIQKQLLIFKFR